MTDAGEPEELEIPTEEFHNIPEVPLSQPEKSTEELLKELNEPFDFISDKNSYVDDNVEEEILISSSEEEDLLKLYDDELKSLDVLEELEEGIKDDKEEIELDISHKEILDEFYDFGNDPDDEISDVDEISSAHTEKEDNNESSSEIENIQDESKDESGTDQMQDLHIRKKNNFPNDLLSYLKDKEIDKIVNSVFDEDREDFAITMDRISECSSYDEATEILKGVFLTYRVNPYSRDAVALTNAVANYFNQA